MSKKSSGKRQKRQAMATRQPAADALTFQLSKHGVKTSKDFASFMSALMCDLVAGKIAPQVGNAACNAGGKLLKIAQLQQQFAGAKGRASAVLALSV